MFMRWKLAAQCARCTAMPEKGHLQSVHCWQCTVCKQVLQQSRPIHSPIIINGQKLIKVRAKPKLDTKIIARNKHTHQDDQSRCTIRHIPRFGSLGGLNGQDSKTIGNVLQLLNRLFGQRHDDFNVGWDWLEKNKTKFEWLLVEWMENE